VLRDEAAAQCALDHCERLVLVIRTIEKAEVLKGELEEFFREDRLVAGSEAKTQ